jgi:hypothetical protein
MNKNSFFTVFKVINILSIAIPLMILAYLIYSFTQQNLLDIDTFLASDVGASWKLFRGAAYLFYILSLFGVGIVIKFHKKREPLLFECINFLVAGFVLTFFSYALVSVFFPIGWYLLMVITGRG